MTWTLTSEVAEYAAKARTLLEQDPEENTVALTVLARLERGESFSDVVPTFGWYIDGGEVTGSVCLTPPHELILVSLPLSSVDALAAQLRAAGVAVPGVNGRPDLVAAFLSAWLPDADHARWFTERERLYALDRLSDPDPMPPGAGRLATPADAARMIEWIAAFNAETGRVAASGDDEQVRFRIANGLIWVWERDRVLVAMAGRNGAVAGVARVGPVYTPPEHRRHGYGAAVTAACSADALARDADRVVLFTDLANATSNAIYQGIGYRPRSDRMVYRFA